MSVQKLSIVLCLSFGLFAICLSGCGTSFETLRKPYMAEYAQLRERISKAKVVAQQAFQEEMVEPFANPLEEPPVFRDIILIREQGGRWGKLRFLYDRPSRRSRIKAEW